MSLSTSTIAFQLPFLNNLNIQLSDENCLTNEYKVIFYHINQFGRYWKLKGKQIYMQSALKKGIFKLKIPNQFA
jgi:hypothetical protein